MFLKRLFLIASFIAFPVAYLYAMQNVPAPDKVFSEVFAGYALALMGTVGGYSKFAKNIFEGFFGEFNAKMALGLTLVVGLGFGYVQFNESLGLVQSFVVGLVAGGFASGLFVATKQTRRLPVGPTESLKK